MKHIDDIDREKVPEERLVEVLRLAELKLDAQLQGTFARDQRASSLISTYTTIASALVGGLVALYFSESINILLFIIGLLPVAGFVVSVFMSLQVLHSSRFNYPGNDPMSWSREDFTHPWSQVLAEQAQAYRDMILENEEVAEKDSGSLILATKTATISFSAAAVWALVAVLV